MKFQAPLIAVENMERSKQFYQTVMRQTVTLDLDQNVTMEGFSLQSEYDKLVGVDGFTVGFARQNNHELYFEEQDFDQCLDHLSKFPELEYVHPAKEYPWGQRVVRFYDPDGHIIEIGESMESVFAKFSGQGLTVEQVAERTMHPVEFVRAFLGGESGQ